MARACSQLTFSDVAQEQCAKSVSWIVDQQQQLRTKQVVLIAVCTSPADVILVSAVDPDRM